MKNHVIVIEYGVREGGDEPIDHEKLVRAVRMELASHDDVIVISAQHEALNAHEEFNVGEFACDNGLCGISGCRSCGPRT